MPLRPLQIVAGRHSVVVRVVSGVLVVPLTATTQNVEGGINDDAHLILANRNFQTDSEEVGQLIRVHQTRMNAEPVRS